MKLKIKIFATLISFLYIVGCKKVTNRDAVKKETIQTGIFEPVVTGRIATDGNLSRGVAWGDYDQDGDPDLYVANSNGQWNFLYRNNGNGTFKKMTSDAANENVYSEVVKHGGNSQGVNWVDYDNDGDLDLYVVSRGKEGNFLFENIENMGFKRILNHPLTSDDIAASMACWVDIENDGDLDVFIVASGSGSNLVFKNQGNGVFERMNDSPLTSGNGSGRACGCGDLNNDGLPDFYVANARKPNLYFKNLGNWKFEKINKGHVVEDIGYSYGVSMADYDEDGDLDLFLANFDKQNFLYNNDGTGNLTVVKQSILTQQQGGASKGHTWGDYDNDTDIDLFIANGTYRPDMHNFLYLNQGNGTFIQDLTDKITKHADTSAGTAHADFDRDGDLDIFVANWGSNDQINKFYKNSTTDKNWITIRLRGVQSNINGIGTQAILNFSVDKKEKRIHRWMYPVTGYGSQNDYELHFGLGNSTKIKSIILKWPSGIIDTLKNITVNKHYLAEEKGELSYIQ